MPLNLMIADDHPLVRKAMCMALMDHSSDFETIEADGLDAARDQMAANKIDLVLMDLVMPGMNGADSLRELRESHPATKIAVMTGQEDRYTILECLNAGVHGYILKSTPIEEIMEAIESILAGHVYVTPSLARSVPRHPALQDDAEEVHLAMPAPHPNYMPYVATRPPRLTKRQVEVLRLLSQGHPTKQIARALDLGIGTVKIHIAGLFRELNARNRTEAALLAAKFNL